MNREPLRAQRSRSRSSRQRAIWTIVPRARLQEVSPLLAPTFSVTYSAGGGGNKHSTNDVAEIIQSDFDTVCVAHLTCAGATACSIAASIEDLRAHNIENVLALRGDIPAGVEPAEFRFAKDLIPTLADAGFCVGAAAYPEGHIGCIDPKVNIEHLKEKVDAGASFLVTQLFFDNDYFYRFRERCTSARIYAPITCGIMPFLSKQQIQRMVFMCGLSSEPHHQAACPLRGRSREPSCGWHRVCLQAARRP